MPTKIEWCEETWNPTVGCTPVSAGCQNCYAKRMFNRGLMIHSHQFDKPTVYYERLSKPDHWTKPRMVFVDSMSDLFHPDIPFDFIESVWMAMSTTQSQNHTFLVLTKRPARMHDFIKHFMDKYLNIVPKNVWLGVSVENQEAAAERIPILLDTPAAVRFVSVEPMLGPVSLSEYWRECGKGCYDLWINGLDWVICGGETGPKHRPIQKDWVISLRDECAAFSVPFFFKSWGGPTSKAGGNQIDGIVYQDYPEVKECLLK